MPEMVSVFPAELRDLFNELKAMLQLWLMEKPFRDDVHTGVRAGMVLRSH